MSHQSPGTGPSKAIAEEVKSQTEKAVSESEKRIIGSIKQSVSDAVDTKYKVVIAQLGSHKSDSHEWQIALAVIPILLTIGLGWWVTRAQIEITRKIDDQKQDLTTRLALTQEYQKRKLDVYQSCVKSMSVLADSLEPLRIDPKDLKNASDAVHDLYDCAEYNSLYVTKDVAKLLKEVQDDAINVMQASAHGDVNTVPLGRDIIAAEKQMLQELTAVTIPLNPGR